MVDSRISISKTGVNLRSKGGSYLISNQTWKFMNDEMLVRRIGPEFQDHWDEWMDRYGMSSRVLNCDVYSVIISLFMCEMLFGRAGSDH